MECHNGGKFERFKNIKQSKNAMLSLNRMGSRFNTGSPSSKYDNQPAIA